MDIVVAKISALYAMQHILADGCQRGDYADVEYTFGLTFEVRRASEDDESAYAEESERNRSRRGGRRTRIERERKRSKARSEREDDEDT